MAVSWNYYDKFEVVNYKYLPPMGEGDNLATQIVTAVNKLVYKWYNDGDVFDNVNSGMSGWANDLSSYANWLAKYAGVEDILDRVFDCYDNDEYEDVLKALADKLLDDEFLEKASEKEKQGSIYDCDGAYEFSEDDDDEW